MGRRQQRLMKRDQIEQKRFQLLLLLMKGFVLSVHPCAFALTLALQFFLIDLFLSGFFCKKNAVLILLSRSQARFAYIYLATTLQYTFVFIATKCFWCSGLVRFVDHIHTHCTSKSTRLQQPMMTIGRLIEELLLVLT